MTDLENREAFLYELNGLGYSFKNTTWLAGIGGHNGMFEDDQLHMAWEVWNASAQREGYKLVSVEPNSKHVEAFWHNFLVEQPNAQTMYFAYKAMIDAV